MKGVRTVNLQRNSSEWPEGFVPVMRDLSLKHQIGFVHDVFSQRGGLQIAVVCNCGWRSLRIIHSHDDAVAEYRTHLP